MRMRTLFTTASAMALSFGVMTGAASAQNNQLVVDQIGSGNFDDTSQVGTGNETLLQQRGNNNTGSLAITGNAIDEDIFVRQETRGNFAQYGGDGNTLHDNDFGVIQRGGNFNTAAFSQRDGNRDNQIGVVQDGSNNVVGGGDTGNANRGWATRTVNSPQLSLTMANQSQASGAVLNNPDADALIDGRNNFVGVAQDGSDHVMGVRVVGNNNTIAGGPLGGSFGTPIDFNGDSGTGVFSPNATIDGDAHVDSLTFGGSGVASFVQGQSDGLAYQSGFGNQAALAQVGNDNIIAFGQISNNNTAQITQQGTGNYHQSTQN